MRPEDPGPRHLPRRLDQPRSAERVRRAKLRNRPANAGIGQYAPCALLASGAPQGFQNGPEYLFEPIFLAYGVTGEQSIANATAAGKCSGLEGTGGLWMCSGANACQMGDFFMDGTTNNNVNGMGIAYDFIPPLNAPSNFTVSPGDNSVTIKWDVTAVPEAGYRILCADENGQPIDNGVSVGDVDETSIVNGTIYYTTENLCPDVQTGDGDPGDGDPGDGDPGDGDPGDGDPGDGDPGDGDGDPGPDMGCVQGSEGCDCYDDDTCDAQLTCSAGVCEPIACTPGEIGCICTDAGECDTPATCEGNICVAPSDGITTLDWSYVCTDHLQYTTTEARITGLENGKTYQFVVVAYDLAGNYIQSEVFEGTPVPTSGLWEACEDQGAVCGEAWGCTCDVPGERGAGGLGWLLGGLGFAGLGLGVARRRRRREGAGRRA